MNKRLTIGIFSCLTVEKYYNQVIACKNTWEKKYNEKKYNEKKYNVQTFYYAGKNNLENIKEYHVQPLMDKNIITDETVGDDYQSSFKKQFRLLKWLHDNTQSDFYLIAGSDTYPVVDKILESIRGYRSSDPVILGSYCDTALVNNLTVPYMSGAGIILSRCTLEMIYNDCDWICEEWTEIIRDKPFYSSACDLALSYIIVKKGYHVINIYLEGICGCNHKGQAPGHNSKDPIQCCFVPDFRNKILFHYMNPEDMEYVNYRL